MGSVKQKFFKWGPRTKPWNRVWRTLCSRSWSFFVYNCTHFCIGVAVGNFFLWKQIQRVPFFPSSFPFLFLFPFLPFLSFLSSLPSYLAFFPFLLVCSFFSLALEELQNSSHRDWGSVVGFPSGFWDRTQDVIEFRALGPMALRSLLQLQ